MIIDYFSDVRTNGFVAATQKMKDLQVIQGAGNIYITNKFGSVMTIPVINFDDNILTKLLDVLLVFKDNKLYDCYVLTHCSNYKNCFHLHFNISSYKIVYCSCVAIKMVSVPSLSSIFWYTGNGNNDSNITILQHRPDAVLSYSLGEFTKGKINMLESLISLLLQYTPEYVETNYKKIFSVICPHQYDAISIIRDSKGLKIIGAKAGDICHHKIVNVITTIITNTSSKINSLNKTINVIDAIEIITGIKNDVNHIIENSIVDINKIEQK